MPHSHGNVVLVPTCGIRQPCVLTARLAHTHMPLVPLPVVHASRAVSAHIQQPRHRLPAHCVRLVLGQILLQRVGVSIYALRVIIPPPQEQRPVQRALHVQRASMEQLWQPLPVPTVLPAHIYQPPEQHRVQHVRTVHMAIILVLQEQVSAQHALLARYQAFIVTLLNVFVVLRTRTLPAPETIPARNAGAVCSTRLMHVDQLVCQVNLPV